MDGPVVGKAREASDNPALTGAARVGFAVSGMLHVLIAWIAVQVAFGGGGQEADQGGALETLGSTGLGLVMLWVAVGGFLGLALWQLAEAAAGPGTDGWLDRGKAVAKCVVYLLLAWSAFSFARGEPSDSSAQTVDLTATLMDKPGGRLLVGLVGLVVLGVGGYHVYKGWSKKFLEDLETHPGGWTTTSGRVGYVAKGLALGIVGLLFMVAALRERPQEASGLDGALKSLREQAFGPWLLLAMAFGLAAFGLYSFGRARHAKV